MEASEAGQWEAPDTRDRTEDTGEVGDRQDNTETRDERPESAEGETNVDEPTAAAPETSDRTDDGVAQPPRWDAPAQETGEPEPGAPEATRPPESHPEPLTEPDQETTNQPGDVADGGEAAEPADEATPDIGREPEATDPPTDQDAPEPSEERPDEIQPGPGDDTDDPGRNVEDQAESQGTDEDDSVIYRIRWPHSEELGPPGTDRLVYHRGRLDPVNENQDLSEPDPEDGDQKNRILRSVRDNPDDAEKNLDNVVSNMIKAQEEPPTGRPASSQDVGNRGDQLHGGQQSDVQGASALVGAAVAAMVALKAKDVISGKVKERRRRDDGDHR